MNELEKKVQSAVNLFKAKNYIEAQKHAENLLADYPRTVFLYNLLGLIFTEKKEINLAIESFKKGIAIDPNNALIYNNIGTAYKIKEDYISSEESFKKSIYIDRNNPETYNNFGNFYLELNQYTKAIKCYKSAILVNPKFYISHYNLGICYKAIGKFVEAKKFLSTAIKLNPNFFTAHRILSQIIKYKKGEEHFDILNNIYQNRSEEVGIGEIAFSLGKVHEDLNDFSASFKYFSIGNRKKRKSIKFSIIEEEKIFEDIKKTFNKDLFLKYKNSGFNNSSVIFIVGMPRSGTTLVEQMISNHNKVYGADELNILTDLVKKNLYKKDIHEFKLNLDKITKDDLKKIGEEYIKKLDEVSKKSEITTDKLTANFKWIGLIKLILPNSKIVSCTRNSKDICLSIFKNYFTNNELNFAYDIDEIVSYYNFYFKLMNHWRNILPNYIYDINYEKLIKEPEPQVKDMLKYCNLDWDPNCLKFYNNMRIVKTASDTQVRKKIYTSSINSWKKFESELNTPFKKLLN